MLCKRLSRLNSPLAIHRRYYSAQLTPPYPFRNIRALPFKLSPEDAQRNLSPIAAMIRHENLLSALFGWAFPILGFEPLKPVQFVPVYFPGWIVDIELKGDVIIKGDRRQALAHVYNSYIPGSDYKVVSSAAIAPYDPKMNRTVPFTNDLLRQHDMDITCIPYNISPFPIIDLIPLAPSKITQDFRFIPLSVKPTLFSAYPILIPLYLAQYEYETDTGTKYHTLFIEGCGAEGNIWSEPLGNNHAAESLIVTQARKLFGVTESPNTVVTNFGYPKRFIDNVVFSHSPHQELGLAIQKYLEDAMNSSRMPWLLAEGSAPEMDSLAKDERVREFTKEDRTPPVKWLKLGSELMMARRMHEAMTQARESGSVRAAGPATKKHSQTDLVDGAIQHLADRAKSLEAERRLCKPEWAKTEEDREEEAKLEPGESKSEGPS